VARRRRAAAVAAQADAARAALPARRRRAELRALGNAQTAEQMQAAAAKLEAEVRDACAGATPGLKK
jgi:hypothetical protein